MEGLLVFATGILILAWLLCRPIEKMQSGDRAYGNPDNWDSPAGHHW